MRKYITEKVGILALFQIIFAILVLCLGYYAFYVDLTWNNSVEEDGLQLCANLNSEIYKRNSSILLVSECFDVLDLTDETVCDTTIQSTYLRTDDKFAVTINTRIVHKKEFILDSMQRWQLSEITSLVLVTCIALFLFIHMIVASCTTAIEIRTKWNAAIQGVVLFVSGFAAMLIEISTNTIDNKYIDLSKEVRICSLLRYCDRAETAHPEISKPYELIINHALEKYRACQAVKLKQGISLLLVIIVITSGFMIFLAMDLVTKYEQESEEEEISTETGVGNLVEDQTIVFERVPESGDETVLEAAEVASRSTRKTHAHGRASATILAEYLAHGPHPHKRDAD